jgi:hypothetical protein
VTTYRDYQFTAAALPAPVSTAPAVQPVRSKTTPGSGLAPLKPTRDPFALSVSSDQTTSLLADRIAAFNLSKPEVVNPYTNINILLTYTWAAQRWQTYLFRFQTKEPFLPLESVTSGEQKSFPLLGN